MSVNPDTVVDMTGITDYQEAIAAEVRAAFGRNGKKRSQLKVVIGRSRPTADASWEGRRAYTAAELDKVASFLGITVYDLNDSARFAESISSRSTEVARITPPQDDWAQPSRSKRRAS